DQLSGEPDIHVVVEDDRHRGQARARYAPQLRRSRRAVQGVLDRHGDRALHLHGREARGRGEHGHLDGGDVRHRVDRELPGGGSGWRRQRAFPALVYLNSSLFKAKTPLTTTRCPSFRPLRTCCSFSLACPSWTGTVRTVVGPSLTNTVG